MLINSKTLRVGLVGWALLAPVAAFAQGLINPGVVSPGGTCVSCTLTSPTLSGTVSVTGTAGFTGAVNLNPANQTVSIAPTGSGTVTVNPATAGTLNNLVIGGSTPLAITGTSVAVTGTSAPVIGIYAPTSSKLGLSSGTGLQASLEVTGGFNVFTVGTTSGSPGKVYVANSTASQGYQLYRDSGTGFLHFDGEQTTFSGYRFRVNASTSALTLNNDLSAVFAGTVTGTTLTASTSVTTPTITTASGNLVLSPAGGVNFATGSTSASLGFNLTGLGSDLRIWRLDANSTGLTINAWNDAGGGVTNAYLITRGTTYNVASHIWYTSTSAGTSVQGMQLGTTGLLMSTGNSLGVSGSGAALTAAANTAYLDNNNGNFRITAWGPNASTNATVGMSTGRSDGTNSLSVFTISTAGLPAFPQVTTGTNTNFVCMASGNVLTLQGSACTISSMRFKHDIAPLTANENLSKVLRMRPVSFVMNGENRDKNQERIQLGLIAEDVAAIDPRMAIYEDDGTTPKSYRQESIIAALVGAVQAQQREIQELRHARH